MDENGPNPPGGPLVPNGGEPALRALALRLLTSEGPSATRAERPRLFVGRLPETLPVEIPIPEGFTLLGSVVRSERVGEPRLEVVLDTVLPAEQAHESYRALMASAGWTQKEWFKRRPGGFESGPPGRPAVFCHGARGPTLIVTAVENRDAPTDFRLRLITDEDHPACAPQRPPRRYERPEFDSVIPRLAPPLNARELMGGRSGGQGRDNARSALTLETELDLAATGVHYAAQLGEAGWSLSGEGQSGPQAWSTWAFTDEEGRPWVGVFTALRLPERPGQYFLQIHANRAPKRQDST